MDFAMLNRNTFFKIKQTDHLLTKTFFLFLRKKIIIAQLLNFWKSKQLLGKQQHSPGELLRHAALGTSSQNNFARNALEA